MKKRKWLTEQLCRDAGACLTQRSYDNISKGRKRVSIVEILSSDLRTGYKDWVVSHFITDRQKKAFLAFRGVEEAAYQYHDNALCIVCTLGDYSNELFLSFAEWLKQQENLANK